MDAMGIGILSQKRVIFNFRNPYHQSGSFPPSYHQGHIRGKLLIGRSLDCYHSMQANWPHGGALMLGHFFPGGPGYLGGFHGGSWHMDSGSEVDQILVGKSTKNRCRAAVFGRYNGNPFHEGDKH